MVYFPSVMLKQPVDGISGSNVLLISIVELLVKSVVKSVVKLAIILVVILKQLGHWRNFALFSLAFIL